MLPRGVCSSQERWCLCCSRVIQHQGPDSCLHNSLPRATNPSVFSHNSSLLYSPFARDQRNSCKKDFVCWPLERVSEFLIDSLSLPGRQKSRCFSYQMWTSLLVWCYELGSLAWAWDPMLIQGIPSQLRYPSGSSGATGDVGPALLSLCPSY